MACEALSICAVIWVLTPEIFPNRVRGRAMSIAIFANWTTNMLGTFLFPWYVERYGMYAGFFTFAAICFVATIFFWALVPETKGKSLEEIERALDGAVERGRTVGRQFPQPRAAVLHGSMASGIRRCLAEH